MELYLLRHGIAEDVSADGSDAARRLTDEGRARMQRAARGMRAFGLAPDLILTSPLPRAHETAAITGAALGVEPLPAGELAPGCTVDRINTLLEHHNQARRIMLVGHEPDLSAAIAAFTGGGQVAMKKGMLAAVELPDDDTLDGTLLWLLPPRALREMGR